MYNIVSEGKDVVDLDLEPSTARAAKAKLQPHKKSLKNSTTDLSQSIFEAPVASSSTSSTSSTASTSAGSPKERVIEYEWAKPVFANYTRSLLSNSNKMIILFEIIEKCVVMGERLLVFSQSLYTLDMIESFLSERAVPGDTRHWSRNTNYFRLDGSTSSTERERMINAFNRGTSYHLFLLSTRAGSLGINLVGANRIVIFDSSWNPCHDAQAACRIYRFGQLKQCYIYRLICDNSLEKKIYDRQVTKQGMSHRVIDEINTVYCSVV